MTSKIENCLSFFSDHNLEEKDYEKISSLIKQCFECVIKVVHYNPDDLEGYPRPYSTITIGTEEFFMSCCGWENTLKYYHFENQFYGNFDTITIYDIQKLIFFSMVEEEENFNDILIKLNTFFM